MPVELLEGRLQMSATVGDLLQPETTAPAAPTATITGLPTAPVSNVHGFSVVFSEPVTGFDANDIKFTNDNYLFPYVFPNVMKLSTSDNITWNVSWNTDDLFWDHTYSIGLFDSATTGITNTSGTALADVQPVFFKVAKPSHSISGYIFNDLNEDQNWDGDERGLSGWTVFLDSNRNGKLNAGETSTTTDAYGNYAFLNLSSKGTYHVARIAQPGWRKVVSNTDQDVRFTAEQPAAYALFWDYTQAGHATGTIFLDANADGKSKGDQPTFSAWAYADENNNGQPDGGEPWAPMTGRGQYDLRGLSPGTHTIRAYGGDDMRATGIPARQVTITSSGTASNVNLTVTYKALIGGSLFVDSNANASHDAGDAPLAKWRVFIDTNGDGLLDNGETSVTTDANGNWAFGNLKAEATYSIRVAKPKSTKAVSTPAGGTFTPTYGQSITDLSWSRLTA